MGTALIYLVVMILVAAVIYLLASAVFGRGEELPPLPPGASPTRLPAGELIGDDVRSVRFQQVLRGYKMSEVDWVLARLGTEIDELRARLAETDGQAPKAVEEHPEQANAGE
ncbi:MAG TPA: DivIVA domain-containing protein [Pseudonocardiaceae bacterium]|nr:DivIVA domain-containing protein [Pseudonocardiaceae bacterium]